MISISRRNILRVVLAKDASLFSPGKVGYLTRSYSSLNTDLQPEEQRKPKRRSRSSKTVKKYTSLPERLVSANGSAASPLPPWDGGLQSHLPDVLQDASASNAEDNSPHLLYAEENVEHEKSSTTRKKRTRKKRSSAESDVSATVSSQEKSDTSFINTLANRRPPRNPLAKEILENLAKFPHCILLTRVGNFYESYFDQAQEVSRLLSIKLTKRTWDDQRIWMCGFPLMHLDKYLKVLVQQHNRSVAMCEEFRRPRDADEDLTSKPTFERRVVRILTPGTLIDEPFLNPYENNFLLSVAEDDADPGLVGMAWIDVSTGEFFTRTTPLGSLRDHVARISPREVVLDECFQSLQEHPIRDALLESSCPISFAGRTTGDLKANISGADELIDDIVDSTADASTVFSPAETSAIGVLNTFLQSNLLEHAPQTLRPLREEKSKRMQIDAHTLKALEIRESIREGGTSGSLMSSIKRTVTSSGTRLLARWLCSPSTSVDEILARQSLVNLFRTRPALRADLIELLKGAEDAMRISQKFLLGKGSVDDLVSIRSTIAIWTALRNRISLEKDFERRESGEKFMAEDWQALDQLMNKMANLSGLAQRIELAIDVKSDQQNETITEESESNVPLEQDQAAAPEVSKFLSLPGVDAKWTIKPQFSVELELLHERFRQLQNEKETLELRYREQYVAPSLTLRHSPSHGLHVHIAKPRKDAERLEKSRYFMPLAESKSTKTYFNQEWFALGNAILETVMSIYSAEKEAFLTLRNETNTEATAIRRNARILEELDVTSAFATLAAEMNFVRPTISDSSSFYIENGRHPSVELGLLQSGRMFTPNTVSMSDSSRLHVVTGPNMAGKSTYLRQIALIAILAQTGSFVPADSAHIGLVDKAFSRIGAKDDLFRDRSTFMVEMLESAEILKNATEKSLVIMDEVGRGTTVQDGLAIAFATIHHLCLVNKSRSLFATHFHELVDMLGYSDVSQQSTLFPNLEFYCTDIDETEDGHFSYTHRMRRGVNRDSHGLKVARLAGMPELAINVAEKALSSIKLHNRPSEDPSVTSALQNVGRQLASLHAPNDVQQQFM
ncbi:uncharacterized protein FOMMEDRAFT_106414 [Fomitiporia mediterranea MF3/22]|uniref:uncharacterized protein n=1 Tax=Fomitiporia mediterranea (strain MF3/22) TaxID=694068 RepID=UPI0004408405|nr:uncharacterized protein FOMMEDRAFT_106414 [Fomitiporia mediterranea MF3/22]EJD04012.1 hypothetical protein FOMMEDRAFT_106414 [Fomitiporia mediterranea MF3/22]